MARLNAVRGKLGNVWTLYRCIIQFVWKASPRFFIYAMVLSVIQSLTMPLRIWLAKLIIDEIASSIQLSAGGQTTLWPKLAALISGMCILWIVDKVTFTLQERTREVMSIHIEQHAKFLILEKVSQIDIAFFETPAFYDQMHNALRDVWRTYNLAYHGFGIIEISLSLIALVAVLASQLPIWLALLLIIASVPQVVGRYMHANRSLAFYNTESSDQRMLGYLTYLLSTAETAKEVRLFGLNKLLLERMHHTWADYFMRLQKLWDLGQRDDLIGMAVSMVGLIIIWVYAITQAVSGYISLGSIVMVLQAAEESRNKLGQFFLSLGIFYEHGIFAHNLFAFLDLKPEAVAGALRRPSDSAPLQVSDHAIEIEFRHVSFRYPHSETWTLRDVSFTLRAGERMALVGENGAGKTTLVKLITRFYDPTEGSILLNGRELYTYDLHDLRANISVIFQDFVRYFFSAGENIGFGRVEYMHDEERVRRAAEQAGALAFIEKLPYGFKTPLGKTFDNGVELSGGQWQKLALSRAFMRDAPLLMLDEPTSALDPLAEYEIYKTFLELVKDKTVLLISHRFTTVRLADGIIVLQNGQVTGNGTHRELMENNPHYAEMFNTQASTYQL